LTLSAGIATCQHHDKPGEELMRCADAVKREGVTFIFNRTGLVFFNILKDKLPLTCRVNSASSWHPRNRLS
jgi:hypothetical protein